MRRALPLPALAQAKQLRFAAVFSDKDIRADMIRIFAKEIDKDFKLRSTQSLRLSLDMFNIFDSGTVLTVLNNSTTQGDAGFAQTNTVVRPRTFTVGLRYQF